MGAIKRANASAQLMARYKYLYEQIFTDEEKKHLVLLIRSNQAELVGRDDLKQRLAINLFKSFGEASAGLRSAMA